MADAATRFLPYGRQEIDEADIEAVVRVLRGDYLTTGPAVPALEAELSRRLGGAHVVVCANGTAALHLMAVALPLEPGDVLVVPTVTFLATANAARYVGAEVEFADVDAETGLMTPATLAAAIRSAERRFGRRPRAATVVHMAGQCGDLPALAAMAAENGLVLMDDAAHAIGTRYRVGDAWRSVGDGTDTLMTAFSFHPVKTMTMGEGGAVATRDAALARKLALLRNHGMERDSAAWLAGGAGFDAAGQPLPWYYEMQEPGFNYRATDLQAALGLSQALRLDAFLARRSDLVRRYTERLAPLAPAIRPLRQHADCAAGWHLFVTLIDFAELGLDKPALMRELRRRGIGSQVHYVPVHTQPYYSRRYGHVDLPGAEKYYAQALSLPLFASLTEADVGRVADALAEIVRP